MRVRSSLKNLLKLTIVNIYRNRWEVKKLKVYLCGEKGCCPSVEIKEDAVIIGEEDNMCTLTHDEWNELKTKIKNGEL